MNVGKRNIDKFLEEIKAKHVSASDISANLQHIHVKRPEDSLQRQVIDLVAKYVAQYGVSFEVAICDGVVEQRRELRNLDLGFLSKDFSTSEAQYYRWRVFSFAQGDRTHLWRLEPFQMCTNGSVWHPPPLPRTKRRPSASKSESSDSGDSLQKRLEDDFCLRWRLDRSARLLLHEMSLDLRQKAVQNFNPGSTVTESEYSRVFVAWSRRLRKDDDVLPEGRSHRSRSRSRNGSRTTAIAAPPPANSGPTSTPPKKVLPGTERLRRRDVKELERLLRDLSPSRADICRAMVWCLDNADSAAEICKLLLERLVQKGISGSERTLRLSLISDVLHNASSVINPAAVVYRREFESHLPRVFENLHEIADSLFAPLPTLRSWLDLSVFSPQYVKGLEAALHKGVLSAGGIAGSAEHGKGSSFPEALFVKLAEWKTQHFSQLEKLCKAHGLNWETSSVERPSDGRSLEEAKKGWLLDRLVTYEVYVAESRCMNSVSKFAVPSSFDLVFSDDEREVLPSDIDGDSLSESDEVSLDLWTSMTSALPHGCSTTRATLMPLLADISMYSQL